MKKYLLIPMFLITSFAVLHADCSSSNCGSDDHGEEKSESEPEEKSRKSCDKVDSCCDKKDSE